MSIELQIRTAALAALVSRSVRERLRSSCLPVNPGFSIDHLEVVPGSASVETLAASAAVRLSVEVFIVTDQALFAKPNDVPDGATVAAGQIAMSYLLSVELKPSTVTKGVTTRPAIVTLAPGAIDFGQLGGVPGFNAQQAQQQLQAMLPTLTLDLTPQLTRLGLPAPNSADIVVVDSVLAVRFDPSVAPRAQLFAGQAWGLFVSGSTVERLLVDRIEPPVMRAVPEARVSARYEAAGDVPRVVLEATLGVRADFIDTEVRLAIDLGAGLSLIPHPQPMLRAAVDWSFHIFADGLLSIFEGAVESLAEGIAEDLIHPEWFGGTPTGMRSFVIDLPLTDLQLPGVQFRFDTLLASADGMTLGGAVQLASLFEPPLKITFGALGSPLRIQLCSQLARTGSGAPSKEPPTIYNTKSNASVKIEGCGALCAIEHRTPPEPAKSVRPFLSPQSLGAPTEEATLYYAIPYAVALALDQPLTLVVRTPRGVRFVDLGRAPKVRFDAKGVILERTHDYYIPDCINVVPGSGAGAGWGNSIDDFKTRPIEEPDWATYLNRDAGLLVQLASVNGLDAGELLRYRSTTHAIDVIADAQGHAEVPVMLTLSAGVAPAQLVRADGRSLAGLISTDSVAFERHLTLPGALRPGLMATPSGSLRVSTTSRQATLMHTVSAFGLSSRLATPGDEASLNPQPLPPVDDGGLAELNPQPLPPVEVGSGSGIASLNPQPLPPVESPELTRAWGERFGIRGLTQVFAVPGNKAGRTAIAVSADGSKLMLDLHPAGGVRIAGTFAGPIGPLDSAGPWAAAASGHQAAVFRVTASAPATRCCAELDPTASG